MQAQNDDLGPGVLVFRRHWIVLVKPVSMALALAGGVVFLAMVMTPGLLVLCLIPLGWIGLSLFRWWGHTFTFTSDGHRLVGKRGMFSISEHVTSTFGGVRLSQSLLGQRLNYGHVEIQPANVEIEYIDNFQTFERILLVGDGQLTDLEGALVYRSVQPEPPRKATHLRWRRKDLFDEGIFAWASLLLSGVFAATLSTVLSLSGLTDELSFSIPLVVASLLLASAHVVRYWQAKRTIILPTRKPITATYRNIVGGFELTFSRE